MFFKILIWKYCCVTMVYGSLLSSTEFSRHGYPTVYWWGSTQLTMSPNELKWSSPPSTISLMVGNTRITHWVLLVNSNHKPKSFMFNTIYSEDTFTSRHENNNQSVNPNLPQCYQLLQTINDIVPFLNNYKVKFPSIYIAEHHKIQELGFSKPFQVQSQLNFSSVKEFLVQQEAFKLSQAILEFIPALSQMPKALNNCSSKLHFLKYIFYNLCWSKTSDVDSPVLPKAQVCPSLPAVAAYVGTEVPRSWKTPFYIKPLGN